MRSAMARKSLLAVVVMNWPGLARVTVDAVFARFGVSADEFNPAWNSFPVNQKMRLAGDLARRYGVKSVPAFVVAGKYRTSVADAGSLDDLFALFEELLAREGLN